MIAAVTAAIALSAPAGATTVSFYLNQSNYTPPTGGTNYLPDGSNYLKLTIWDGTDAVGRSFNGYTTGSGDVVFELQTLAPVKQYQGAKFGLDEFAFNTTLALNQFNANSFKGLPSNWAVGIGSQNADGFGKFELTPNISQGGANNVADPLFFAISGINNDSAATYQELASGNPGQGQFDFAAHVINFSLPTDTATTSAWFGGNLPAPVPLPAAVWLLLSGLGGLKAASRLLKA
jgi:hypothetical protein